MLRVRICVFILWNKNLSSSSSSLSSSLLLLPVIIKTLLLHRCALRKFHVKDSQNTRDQITSDRGSKHAWSNKLRYVHSVEVLGVRCFGKIQIQISESKNGLCVFWSNPITDHESIKSIFRVDSLDQIQIRIFEIHNLSVFLGKDLKKVFSTSSFSKKKMIRNISMPYMYGILTEPMLVAPY